MKKVIFILLILSSNQILLAQSKTPWSITFSLSPVFCNTINTTGSNDRMPGTNTSYTKYVDSVKAKETYRFNVLTPTFWFNYSLGLDLDLQTGLGYMDVGYQRIQDNLHLHDNLYPGIGTTGTLTELTSNPRSINYDYRFQYLHIPCLINYVVKKSGDFKTIFSVSGGVAFDILLKHKITANLQNDFYIDGKQQFNIDSTGYKARAIAFQFIVGGRMDYKFDKKLTLMVQPVFGICPFSVTSNEISVYPYYFALNTGIIWDIAN